MSTFGHDSVMLNEALEGLDIKPDGVYIDATYGRGGHSRAILEKLKTGRLLIIDKDPQAISHAEDLQKTFVQLVIAQGSFADIKSHASRAGITQVDGILFDLGVSSPQLDDASRGFSFMKQGPLDMRMNPNEGRSAAQWLADAKEDDIAYVLKTYGEERFAKRIAQAICVARAVAPIQTTQALVKIIEDAQPIRDKHKHPATRSFQAIRMFVNQELADIEKAVAAAVDLLKVGGRLVVITFHSLEDRLVKTCLKHFAKADLLPIHIPVKAIDIKQPILTLLGKQQATAEEVQHNPRARSAMMRIAQKNHEK